MRLIEEATLDLTPRTRDRFELSPPHPQQLLDVHAAIPLPQVRLMSLDSMHGHAVRELIALVADVASDMSQREPGFDIAVNRIGSLNDAEVLDLAIHLAPALLFPAYCPLRYAIERVGRV